MPASLTPFNIYSSAEPLAGWPNIALILEDMKTANAEAIDYISSLSSDTLNEPNIPALKFGDYLSKRICIQHAIRHEVMHGGQLS
jgi:uncharacterized damage-inducible protein DinB